MKIFLIFILLLTQHATFGQSACYTYEGNYNKILSALNKKNTLTGNDQLLSTELEQIAKYWSAVCSCEKGVKTREEANKIYLSIPASVPVAQYMYHGKMIDKKVDHFGDLIPTQKVYTTSSCMTGSPEPVSIKSSMDCTPEAVNFFREAGDQQQYGKAFYRAYCECQNGASSKNRRAQLIAEMKINHKNYNLHKAPSDPTISSPLTDCPIRGDSNSGNSNSSGPTDEERMQKIQDAFEAGIEKNEYWQDRKNKLQDNLDSPEGVEYVTIEDRSGEAAEKANYDVNDDLALMFDHHGETKNLENTSGEYDEDDIKLDDLSEEELNEALKEYELWQKENGLGQRKENARPINEIFKTNIKYEQGKERYDNCDNTSPEDEQYSSSIDKQKPITLDDILEDPFLDKAIGEYTDEIYESMIEFFVGSGAAGGFSFYDRINDYFRGDLETSEAFNDDINQMQEGFFDVIFSKNSDMVEKWLEEKQNITGNYLERYKLWNKLRAIKIKNEYEKKDKYLNHDDIMEQDCDEVEYNYSGYTNNIGNELDKILGKESGILSSLLYGLW